MHVYLRRQECDIHTDDEACDTVIYGPSTSNQASIRRFHIKFKQTLKKAFAYIFFVEISISFS